MTFIREMTTREQIRAFVAEAHGDVERTMELLRGWIEPALRADPRGFVLVVFEDLGRDLHLSAPLLNAAASSALVQAHGDLRRMEDLLREELDARENPEFAAAVHESMRQAVVRAVAYVVRAELADYHERQRREGA